MGSVQNIKEPGIEATFGQPPISSCDSPVGCLSFQRCPAKNSTAAKQGVSGTMSSSVPSSSSVTASVHASPSSLIPAASVKCAKIKEGFVMAQRPGDILALILDTSVQPAVNNALGSVSVDQPVAVKSRKNDSVVVGREGKNELSDIDRGSMTLKEISMGSVQNIKEPGIEVTFGKRPISSRDLPDGCPSSRRGPAKNSTAAKQAVSGTMSSSGPSISSGTASVHPSPSSLIPAASIKCANIKEGFEMAQIPGDSEAAREGKNQLSDIDRGSKSWFGMCFRGGCTNG